MITNQDIENWFTYHPPSVDDAEKYEKLRKKARKLAISIIELTPSGEDQFEAIRHLREAIMNANAAIACEGK